MALKGKHQWYCNACGALFLPNDHSSRFCSRACANRALVEFRAVPLYLTEHRERTLDVLRKRKHQNVSLDYLARHVIGADDLASKRAMRGIVGRLTLSAAPYGLKIVKVYGSAGNNNLGLAPVTHYRMEEDIQLPEESA